MLLILNILKKFLNRVTFAPMAAIKPSVPKGTRDFSPTEMVRRNFIFDTIKSVFRKYGYQQIETPSMENLSTLTGKYGDEGDKLIFKVLESGEYSDAFSRDLTQIIGNIELEKEVQDLISDLADDFADQIVNIPYAL